MGYNDNKFGKGLHPCCTTSIYSDTIPPYYSVNSRKLAFTDAGLPYGETIGYFRFKPEKMCDCGKPAVTKLTECCSCEPGEYNPAEYAQDVCPSSQCCC
ncbi:hypothetical protein PoB_000654500 [Plakobranchus ocellatus]|uniref:Uncharacterized protein n=1 Tax=Plakobranchus ocellatus TaxID=259542 RepID=A0AAV3YBA9_9GAST|nr:hypothetical protein PoB_000654500 [Plakobranchus ocellatus]